MFAKLLALILTGTVTGATLLTLRQQRIQAGHEMIAAFDEARALEEQVWKMRADIAARILPTEVERIAAELGSLTPIPSDWCPPLTADAAFDTPQPGALVLLPEDDPLITPGHRAP